MKSNKVVSYDDAKLPNRQGIVSYGIPYFTFMSSIHVPGHIHMPYVGILGDKKSKHKQEEKESWKI